METKKVIQKLAQLIDNTHDLIIELEMRKDLMQLKMNPSQQLSDKINLKYLSN